MENDAADQLAAIARARTAAADLLVTPWWYHPLLGLAVAGFVLGYGLGNTVVRLTTAVFFVLACVGLSRAYRRLTGVWISGLEAGPAGRWAKAAGALIGIIGITAWSVGAYTGARWAVYGLAAVALVATVVLGRRFDAALRAQLRAGA